MNWIPGIAILVLFKVFDYFFPQYFWHLMIFVVALIIGLFIGVCLPDKKE